MKAIRIEMKDGSIWDVPFWSIARHRAKYMADMEIGLYNGEKLPTRLDRENARKDNPIWEDWYTKYDEESLADDNIILGWARDNMFWCDVMTHARAFKAPMSYHVEWLNSEKKIIDR